jgi:GNAT superfamily N-acetyltransferase
MPGIDGPGGKGSQEVALEGAPVVLREPTIQDAQGISVLMAELGYNMERQGLARVLNDRDRYLLVAEAGGQVVGFVNAYFRFHLHHGGIVGTIDELIVSEKYHGQGIGRELIEAVIDRARSTGAKAVDVSCHLRRAEAHAFYEQCGFERPSYKFIRFLGNAE